MDENPPFVLMGGCFCGGVRYRSKTRPLNALVCHCRTCQKTVGSAFNASILFKDDAIELEGGIVYYSSSPILERGHCGRCGSSVVARVRSRGWTMVTAGTLDDPAQFHADAHVWTCEKQPWLAISDGLPTFEQMSPKG
ncbi:GFA family protein [Mesorhizobium sp. CCNWLW179-1]|uniref:GFA family protein n=1 Tax=unclassified Mesorhizobium TaxID=325217 RepID=UPI003014A96A